MRKIRRFRELSFDDRALLIHALILLPIAKVFLQLGGFNRTRRFFARMFAHTRSVLDEQSAEQRARATMRIVAAAAAHGLCRATCLPQSLVGWALLRQQGLDPELRFGARKRAHELEAHAWVELGSIAFEADSEQLEQPFVPFTKAV